MLSPEKREALEAVEKCMAMAHVLGKALEMDEEGTSGTPTNFRYYQVVAEEIEARLEAVHEPIVRASGEGDES